jgi:UDP-glucuronate decarboxylase
MSSSEIYGDPDPRHVPTPESYRGNVACQGPRACYDEGKRVGETLCHIFHERFGTRINTVRPFNVYGPGMLKDDYRVLPNFASRIVAGDRLKVYGTGAQTRTYCYVTDAVTGFFKALLKGVPGEVYNIGCTGPEVSVLDLVRAIERVLGRSVAYDVIEHPDSYPADEPLRRCPDIRKATLQLGYAPRIGLEEGLGRFLTWASDAYTAGGGTADAGR